MMTKQERMLRTEAFRRKAQVDMLAFLKWCWWMPHPLVVGRHTRAICGRLTRAIKEFKQGKSTRLLVDVTFRHGKTDMVSVALPAFFLGAMSELEPNIMLVSYNQDLPKVNSEKIQNIIRKKAYQALFPKVRLSQKKVDKLQWGVDGSVGKVYAFGIHGGATGKGAHLLVVDDPIKDQQEAFSSLVREDVNRSFGSSFFTRLADPYIVIICNTRWHSHDLTGSILESMEKDPHYPRYEHLSFPAGDLIGDYLFPERYTPDWYKAMRKTIESDYGVDMAKAMMDCTPVDQGARLFQDDWLEYWDTLPKTGTMNRYIFVDTASSKKKGSDYTSMFVIGWGIDKNYYVLDIIHDRLNLKERTEAIFDLVERWDPRCVYWETVGAMSDAEHIKEAQQRICWRFKIVQLKQSIPKLDRIAWLAPEFENRRIILPRRLLSRRKCDGVTVDIIADFVRDEYRAAPALIHDDMLDCLANVRHPDVISSAKFPLGTRLSLNSGDNNYSKERSKTILRHK